MVKLASITFPKNTFKRANTAFRRKTANMNPAAITVFFHKVCTGILKVLVSPGESEIRIFSKVSTYYMVVKTNGHGMLHLHCLVWLAGNLDFFNLREEMLNDAEFASQMIDYLDSIISEYIDACESKNSPSLTSMPSQNFKSDQDYVHVL